MEDATASILSSLIAFFGVLATVIGVQLRVHRDNRNDHAETGAKVDQLVLGQADIAADVREVKAEIRDLRADVREADGRLTQLEGEHLA